jgi:anti-anti-sigma regulatory factor
VAETPTRWVLINAEAITYVDTSGVVALRELREELAAEGSG